MGGICIFCPPASLLLGDSNFLSLSRYPTLRTQTCVLALWWSGPTPTLHTMYTVCRSWVGIESLVWVQHLIRGCWVKIGSVWVKRHTYTQLTIKEPNTTLQFIMGTDNTKSSGWLGVNAAPLVKKTRLYCIHTYKNLTHIQLRPDVGHSLCSETSLISGEERTDGTLLSLFLRGSGSVDFLTAARTARLLSDWQLRVCSLACLPSHPLHS